jgi:A/G-specific adenine glycosylase
MHTKDFHPNDARAIRRALVIWYQRYGRRFPWRVHPEPFAVLVAEVLLKQTGSWKAERAFVELIRLAPTPEALRATPLTQILRIVRPLGLHQRAQQLRQMAGVLVDQHGGGVPSSLSSLKLLPGVGDYIGRAVRVFALGKTEPLVDAMTSRFYHRLYGSRETRPAYLDTALWSRVQRLQPRKPSKFHLAVIDLAATVCTHREPKCESCPVRSFCRARRQRGLSSRPGSASDS